MKRRNFPDMHVLRKPRWREALQALVTPAVRVHEYRNLHKSMFYQAMCDYERKDC